MEFKTTSKKRIDYIDLMKGICIILVVLLHCDIQIPYEHLDLMLRNVRMPLYFFLSGLFFKEYASFFDFTIRKINKLIIPYIFFAFFPFTLASLVVSDLFPQKTFFLPIRILYVPLNYPLWFLRGLFLTYILYYGFHRISKSWPETIKLIIIILISVSGWIVNNEIIQYRENTYTLDLILSMNIMVPFIALPYFYIASLLKKRNVLTMNIKLQYAILGICIFAILWYFTAQSGVDYMFSKFSDNYIFLYIASLSGIGVIWLLSYTLKKIPVISYLGRYSIIILGTHIFFINILNTVFNNSILTFIFTIAFMPITIWLFKTVFPYFTAQKDIFYLKKNGKLGITWKK